MKNLIAITISMTFIGVLTTLSGCDANKKKSNDPVATATAPVIVDDTTTTEDAETEVVLEDHAIEKVEIQSSSINALATVYSQVVDGVSYHLVAPTELHPAKNNAYPTVEAQHFRPRRRVVRLTLDASFSSTLPEATMTALTDQIKQELGIEEVTPVELDLENAKVYFNDEELEAKFAKIKETGEIRIHLRARNRRGQKSKYFTPLKDIVKGLLDKEHSVTTLGLVLKSQFKSNGETVTYELPLTLECININSAGWASIDKSIVKCVDLFQ